MANGQPHGFAFDHVGRRPTSMSMRQRRTKPAAPDNTRSSFRLSSLRSALFNGHLQTTKTRQQQNARETSRGAVNVDKSQSSGVLRSLFSRQVDSKSPPGGDLWVDVDLHRSTSPALDDVSVTSSDWAASETAAAASSRRPELDRSSSMEEDQVAMVRRSNSARPASRRPLPIRQHSVPHQTVYGAEVLANGPGVTAQTVCVPDSEPWSPESTSSHNNNARLSADSGHVSCKLH